MNPESSSNLAIAELENAPISLTPTKNHFQRKSQESFSFLYGSGRRRNDTSPTQLCWMSPGTSFAEPFPRRLFHIDL
jgi:hypothetical protein